MKWNLSLYLSNAEHLSVGEKDQEQQLQRQQSEVGKECKLKRGKRKRRHNTTFKDFHVFEFVNEPDEDEEMDLSNEDTAGNSSDNISKLRLKRLYYEILDNILQELKDRFSNNGELLGALEAAENLSLNAGDYKYF